MGIFSKDIKTLDNLFVNGLRTILYAENEIAAALPEMIEQATAADLKQAFDMHLRETREQIARLEQVFHQHGVEIETANCPVIDAILKVGSSLPGNVAKGELLDAALIGAAQLVEHYEIARYGTLSAWARELGRPDCAGILDQTLAEEKSADTKLSRVATDRVNHGAKLQAA